MSKYTEMLSSLWEKAKENLLFLLVCLGIAALLFAIAAIAEKTAPKTEEAGRSSVRRITVTALCAALGAVLMLFDIPLFFAPSFYKLDFSEVPVLICGFALGPVAGVVCEFLKVLLKLLIKGTTTAFVGDFSSFVIGCALVLPATVLYRYKKTKKRALIGLITGSLVMTVFGSLFNTFYLIPQYARLFHMPLDTIVAAGTAVNPYINSVTTLVLFAVVPFNLVKSVIVSALTMFLYKFLKNILLGRNK